MCTTLFWFPSAPYTDELCHLQHEASAARTAPVSHVLSPIPASSSWSLPTYPSTPAPTERRESLVPPQPPRIQMVCKPLTALTGHLSIQNISARQLHNLSVGFSLKLGGSSGLHKYFSGKHCCLQVQSYFYLIHIFFISWASSPCFSSPKCYLDSSPSCKHP